MNLREIERKVYRRLSKNSSTPNPETQDRIRDFINERHRRLLRKFPELRDATITFASVASQQTYALPEQGIARINRIWETTNDRVLYERDLTWLRTHDPDPQTGTSAFWIPTSYTQVHTQPSNASAVFVDSTSASDVNRAFIEGMVTGGTRRSVEVTMTGTTAVNVDAAIADWIQIDKFYLSEQAVGTVTLHEDASGGTELSKIAIGDLYAKYLSFLLWPTPSGIITYTADIMRAVADMANPTDEPLLPLDFHDMLAIGARLDEYEHLDDSRRSMAEVEWDEAEKALITWMVAKPSTRISLNREPVGISRTGAWTPVDTWLDR